MILPNSPHSPWPGKCSFHSACPLVDPNSLPHKTTPTDHTPFSGTEAGRRHPWLPCATPDLSGGQEDMKEVDPKLLVLWGMDNDGEPVGDVWMLNVNSLTWKKVLYAGGGSTGWGGGGAPPPPPPPQTLGYNTKGCLRVH